MDPEESDHWIRTGHAMYAEFMSRVEKIDRMGVKGMNESTEEKRVTLIDKRKVYATLEEIADLYVSDEKKLVLDFTESKAVAVFRSPTKERPMEYIGFRWSYYRTPSRLVRSQDFFYLETMKPFVDVYGRRGWAKCSHSIEHPICPDTSASRGINRGRLYYSGVVFVESREKGVLETTFYYSIDTTSIPAFLLPVVMKARGKNNAALINHYVKLSRMTAYAGRTNSSKLQQQLVEEKRCGACSNRMPKWSSKAKCHFCKSFVCKRCCEIVSKNYLFDGDVTLNSCMLCAESNGSKITSLMDDAESSHSSSHDDADIRAVDTPSSVGTPDRHRHHHSRPGSRSMSVPPANRNRHLPPKLIDFGLDDMDLNGRVSRQASVATASTTDSQPSPSAAPPSRHHEERPIRSNQEKQYDAERVLRKQEKQRERDRCRRAPHRSHIDRVPSAPLHTLPGNEEEPVPTRPRKATAYAQNSPCDLSYLSAFKV